MKTKPTIESILILTGTEFRERASQIFKKYFFSKTKSLEAILALDSLNKKWIKDSAIIADLDEVVENRIAEFAKKNLDTSAQLKEQEWSMIGKLSELKDFNLYNNRSSAVFGNTRVYLAYKDVE